MSTADSRPTDALRAHSDRIAAIVEQLGASTVAVAGRRGAIASGSIWRPGLVVTAAHVFRRTPAALTLVDAAGASRAATLVGIDSSTDLALFRLAEEGALAPLAATPATPVRAGHFADRRRPQRRGRHDRQRRPRQPRRRAVADLARRLDRPAHPPRRRRLRGPSGAPVADADGAVIGVATAALSRSYGIVVPASTVSRVVDALLAHGRVALAVARHRRADRALAGGGWRRGRRSGLLVTSLATGGPAERAGLLIGDIIVRAAEGAAANLRELRQALASHVGQTVALAVLRGGAPLDLQAAVGEWPGERRCH